VSPPVLLTLAAEIGPAINCPVTLMEPPVMAFVTDSDSVVNAFKLSNPVVVAAPPDEIPFEVITPAAFMEVAVIAVAVRKVELNVPAWR